MQLRRVHKLVGIVIFLPTLLWGLSGAFLAWKNWDRDAAPPRKNPQEIAKRPFRVELDKALAATGQPKAAAPRAIEWRHLADAPYFVIRYAGAPPLLIDGETGEKRSEISEELARRIAAAEAPPDVRITGCALQTTPSLVYLQGMPLPVYRVSLSDGSDVYVAPTSGEVQFRAPRLAWFIRFAYFGMHVWKWSSGPGPHYSYLFLLVMALVQCVGSVSGLWLWLKASESASRRRAKRDTPAP